VYYFTVSAYLECECNGLRQRKREATDLAIINAAFELIEEIGYDAMTMDELANRLNLSKRTIYLHFPSKEAIATRAIALRIQRIAESITNFNKGAAPKTRLEGIIGELVRKRLTPIPGAAGEIKAHSELMAQIRSNPEYIQAAKQLEDELRIIVEEIREDNAISPGFDSEIAVRMILALTHSFEYRDLVNDKRKSIEQVTDSIVTFVIHGFGLKKSIDAIDLTE